MNTEDSHDEEKPQDPTGDTTGKRTPSVRWKPAFIKLARRAHLYAGLFLLPWVFLYGITGAMFNHMGLFPAGKIHDVPASQLAGGTLKDFPTADALAAQVVEALQAARPNASIQLQKEHGAAFNNDLLLETRIQGVKHVIHVDPVEHSARVVIPVDNVELKEQVTLLPGLNSVKISDDPHELAKKAVPEILTVAGMGDAAGVQPVGWCKLNFLADIDGEPARVTYVLRDGHVDITKYTGEDGMHLRQTFLRMHTFHGRTPDSSARNVWSFFLDTMAIAMVLWGLTGLIMWWQLKSLRTVGGVVLLASVITAVVVYGSLVTFHAMTKM